MKILAIETSCDETAIAVVEVNGGFENPQFNLLADNLNSQIEIHKKYGGVYPNLARREHGQNILPVLLKTLEEGFGNHKSQTLNLKRITSLKLEKIKKILERETELLEIFLEIMPKIQKPDLDYIAVTEGPGLEPALWVGINFAKALSTLWDTPLIPVNHMEGHVLSVLYEENMASSKSKDKSPKIVFPALALLISGGHTELVLMKDWLQYEVVGETQDDAVGEAFDKVARMMDLSYPGGPEISKLAEKSRHPDALRLGGGIEKKFDLPKPMINSGNCHFSFSGLKTAVLYKLQGLDLDEETKAQMAREFEDTVVEILLAKTKKAIKEHGVKTLIIGGGVIANREIRKAFQEFSKEDNLNLLIPEMKLTTDNAIMIAIAGYFRALKNLDGLNLDSIKANGNLSLTEI